MKLDNKKIGILFILGAAVVGVTLLFVFLLRGEKEPKLEKVIQISADVPDANAEALPDSKMDAFDRKKKRSIEDYWDSMADDAPKDEDPVADLTSGGRAKGGSGVRTPSYEELFGPQGGGGTQESVKEARERRDRESAERMAQLTSQQNKMLEDIMSRQQEQQDAARKAQEGEKEEEPDEPAVPERERIDVERVKVVRSGGISSLDDGYSSSSNNGFSSLDGDDAEFDADEAYPFKCMFVRAEKLKSGQRVSVRLLEDIVVEGQLVRKNTHLNAVCQISDRVDLSVSSIDLSGKIINLNFVAYDTDGTKGIYAPDLSTDSQLENAIKQTGINAVRRRMNSKVGQTVQDIVQAGSMVITGTGKDRSVMIPAGYQFYLVKAKSY